jgi:peroxiredoxin Q/BCP
MLTVGSAAPDFTLPNQDDENITLSQFKGKWIVLYFYPKDMTPGCIKEACSFQEGLPDFSKIDAVILGISKDSIVRHKKFAQKYELQFSLLSDENSNVCETYEIWQKKKLYGREFMGIVRSTYIINPQGKIAEVYPKVKVKEHAAQVLEFLKTQ